MHMWDDWRNSFLENCFRLLDELDREKQKT